MNLSRLVFLSLMLCMNDFASSAQNIGQSSVVFFDESRSRKLVTELWFPTDDKQSVEAIESRPPKTNASHYAQNIRGAEVEILPGSAGHYVFLNECTDFGREVASFICTDDVAVNREAIHKTVAELISSFLNPKLK